MNPLLHHHPEAKVGGYTSIDSSVEFYLRARTLLKPGQTVLDLGAGRAAWAENTSFPPLLRDLMDLRGNGRHVIGIDIDPIVLKNPMLDEARVITDSAAPFPVATASVDIVFSDWTFEHLENPASTARELARVLKPGGWLCARTPNKNGYISIANRLIPTSLHQSILGRGQPERQEKDIFPTVYQLNTSRDVKRFLSQDFEVTTYTVNPEPSYLGRSSVAWWAAKSLERLTPRRNAAVLLIFARRRDL